MKKKFLTVLLQLTGFLLSLSAQTPSNMAKSGFIKDGDYLSIKSNNQKLYGDSLAGFDEAALKIQLLGNNVYGQEYITYMKARKRDYINEKYRIGPGALKPDYASAIKHIVNTPPTSGGKSIGGNNAVNTFPCVNEGFESTAVGAYTASNSVNGWTVTSGLVNGCNTLTWSPGSTEFSIVATPITNFPGIGTVSHSPLGGSKVAWLNNLTPNTYRTKLATTFPVTSSNNLFQFAFAGYYQAAGHTCCDNAGLMMRMLDCNNQVLNCASYTLTEGCSNVSATYTASSSGWIYTDWQVKFIDLTPFIGSCVTFECWTTDCSFGGHYGTTLFDASCGSQLIQNNLTPVNNVTVSPVSLCPGTNSAVLTAPLGYSTYSWVAPPTAASISAAQATLSTITVPVSTLSPTSVYSVMISSSGNCQYIATYTVSPFNTSQVGIVAYGSSPSCSQGSSGSATVQAYGSNVGYTYSWLSPLTNSVVSTASVATGLVPGVYTVMVSAPNVSACGVSTTTVAVNTGTVAPTAITKKYCSTTAYFTTTVGTNFQWYLNNVPVSGATGTASSFVMSNAYNGAIVRLGRNYQGCRDSVVYNLLYTIPNPINISVSGSGCPGSNNGSAAIAFTPVTQSSVTSNSFSVVTAYNTTYSSSITNTTATAYSVTGLPVGQTLSVSIFDGTCYSGTVFMVSPNSPPFNYTLSSSSNTVCNGGSINANINFSVAPGAGQYLYSWSPSSFMAPNSSSLQSVVISPTAMPGNLTTYVYTVVVTPSVANCPITQTISVVVANPVTPSITAVPAFCNSAPSQAILVSPPNGTFTSNGPSSNPPIGASSGIITPSLCAVGTNTFLYTIGIGTCQSTASSSFMVYGTPTLNVSGNTVICAGDVSVLNAAGATSYLWSNSSTAPAIVVSPVNTTVYSVNGSDASGNCTATKQVTVLVNALPSIMVNGNFSICTGQTSTVNATGASTFTWSNGLHNPTQLLSPASTSNYTVTGKDSLSGCLNSQVITVVVSGCVGITEQGKAPSHLKAYPNPAGNHFNLEASDEVHVIIYDATGRQVLQKSYSKGKHLVDISGLSAGIYFILSDNNVTKNLLNLIKLE